MFKLKTTLGTNNICGANLIRLRHERGISQRQLAKNMQIAGYDVDHHFIRRIENGERFVTDIELVALAKVLQVEITDLIDPAIPVAVQKIDGERHVFLLYCSIFPRQMAVRSKKRYVSPAGFAQFF